MSESSLAGVVLAAGRGQRLQPLTNLRPKPLCPIANRPLVDLALERLTPHTGSGPSNLAANVHYLPDLVRHHLGDRVHISEEQPVALGTAGALGLLRDWIDGRAVLLTNSDAYLPGGLDPLLEGWEGRRIRLLGKDIGAPADFGTWRYVGACLLPWDQVARLSPTPSGLYEVMWRDQFASGGVELVDTGGVTIDCGTPGDYLRANLHASGGQSVIGANAVVEGELVRSVIWPDAHVAPGERLVDAVRAGDAAHPITVYA